MDINVDDKLKDEGSQYASVHVEKTQVRSKYNAKTDRKKIA